MTTTQRFFEELPSAVVAYSAAIGAASMAVMLLRAAVHLFTGV